MNMLALRRHPPGWLALAAAAMAMAVCSWPHRLGVDALLPALRQAWASVSANATRHEPAERRRMQVPASGLGPFGRATGTPLPVLATVAAPSPLPPGPSQIVRCRHSGRMVYADSWSACPTGIGQLVSLAR